MKSSVEIQFNTRSATSALPCTCAAALRCCCGHAERWDTACAQVWRSHFNENKSGTTLRRQPRPVAHGRKEKRNVFDFFFSGCRSCGFGQQPRSPPCNPYPLLVSSTLLRSTLPRSALLCPVVHVCSHSFFRFLLTLRAKNGLTADRLVQVQRSCLLPDSRKTTNLQAKGPPGGGNPQRRCGSSGGKGGAGGEAGGDDDGDGRGEEGLDESSRGRPGGVTRGSVEGGGGDLMDQILHYFLLAGDGSDLAPLPCGSWI